MTQVSAISGEVINVCSLQPLIRHLPWAVSTNALSLNKCPHVLMKEKLSLSANRHTHDSQLNPNNDAKLSSATRVQVSPNYWLYRLTCSSTTARAKRVSASLRGWSAALTNTEILKQNNNHQGCLKLGWLLVAELSIFQLMTCLCGVITIRSKHCNVCSSAWQSLCSLL